MRERKANERKKKDYENIRKLWWRYHLYYKEDLDETNLTALEKITNDDQSGSYEPLKAWLLDLVKGLGLGSRWKNKNKILKVLIFHVKKVNK